MDLLAAFFISSTIVTVLKEKFQHNTSSSTKHVEIALRASVVATLLLAAIYVGFSYLAAIHGGGLSTHVKDELLAGITMRIAGPYAGALVSITVSLACLTTAIALITAFTNFVQQEVFNGKASYAAVLSGALLLTFFVSTFEFTGISIFLEPALQMIYPGLIVLTFLNIAYKVKQFSPIKVPVFAVFILSVLFYLR